MPRNILDGGMAEWSKAAVLKTVSGATRSWVRIPVPPPFYILQYTATIHLPEWKDKKNWTVETGDKKRVQVQNRKDVINRTLKAALKDHGYEIPQKPEPLQADDNPATYYQPNFRIELAKSYK